MNTSKKKRVFFIYAIVLAIGLCLVAYVVYLLISNYTSQAELQKALVNQFKRESETRAASIDYFFFRKEGGSCKLGIEQGSIRIL